MKFYTFFINGERKEERENSPFPTLRHVFEKAHEKELCGRYPENSRTEYVVRSGEERSAPDSDYLPFSTLAPFLEAEKDKRVVLALAIPYVMLAPDFPSVLIYDSMEDVTEMRGWQQYMRQPGDLDYEWLTFGDVADERFNTMAIKKFIAQHSTIHEIFRVYLTGNFGEFGDFYAERKNDVDEMRAYIFDHIHENFFDITLEYQKKEGWIPLDESHALTGEDTDELQNSGEESIWKACLQEFERALSLANANTTMKAYYVEICELLMTQFVLIYQPRLREVGVAAIYKHDP